jgi:hypothetical protein
MTDFLEVVGRIAARPAMYVGTTSLSRVANFLDGYSHAMWDLGRSPNPLDGWMRWVELRFGICHPGWSWTRILAHCFGTDDAAIRALPALFKEFFSERQSLGAEALLEQHREKFSQTGGFFAPSATATSEPVV